MTEMENTNSRIMEWNKYSNKDLGFKIEFPQEITYRDWRTGVITFRNISQTEKNDFSLIISYNYIKESDTLQSWADKMEKMIRNNMKRNILSVNNLMFSRENSEAVKLIFEFDKYSRAIVVLARSRERIYEFFCAIKNTHYGKYGVLFEKMLSTIEFI
jgi:hypothetical protein